MVIATVEVSINGNIRLGEIPVTALKHNTIELLSLLLDRKKVFKSEDGYCRDWRGLLQKIQLQTYYLQELECHKDPTRRLLNLWQKSDKNANLQQLQNILREIDRWDVLDDSNKLFYDDAEHYLDSKQKFQKDNTVVSISKRVEVESNYDAFILYADSDIELAKEIIDHMEGRHLKLCAKDRDLPGGAFEFEEISKLISERCRRLIIVVSQNFLKSPMNAFFVMFAQALQIEQRQRKIIPCVYQRMELPSNLRIYFVLDFNRNNSLFNFWEKLEDAIKEKSETRAVETIIPTVTPEPSLVPVKTVENVDESVENQPAANTTEHEQKPIAPSLPDTQIPMKKAFSSLDISCPDHMLDNNVEPSSATELPIRPKQEKRKKPKWYSKWSLSSTNSDKKKKCYKSNKKIATAL